MQGGGSVTAIVGASKAQILIEDLQEFKQIAGEEADGEKVSFRLARELFRALEVMRQGEGSPHLTLGDQLRDAVQAWTNAVHALEKRGDPRITAWLHHHRIQGEAAWLERHLGEVELATHRIRDHALFLIQRGRFEQATRVLGRHWGEIKKIQDDEWREDYVDAAKRAEGFVVAVRVLVKLGYRVPQDMKGLVR